MEVSNWLATNLLKLSENKYEIILTCNPCDVTIYENINKSIKLSEFVINFTSNAKKL